jgi:ComF family protein
MLDLCEPCHRELPILTHFCLKCAAFLKTQSLCEQCTANTPPFDRTYALLTYEDNVKRLILNLKFQQDLKNARLLGELLTVKIQQDWYREQSLPSVIIPVPLHKKRLKARGFNQALEIARPISKALDLPIDITSCERIKFTKPQATLHAEERLENVANAFQVYQDFSQQHIAVLDDVITTGHTITAFTSALKKAGANRVDVWCCARAVMRKLI